MRLPPKGWVPVRVSWRDGAPQVQWMHLGHERFEEPFFADTVSKGLRKPFNQLFCPSTPITALAEREPDVAPTGFIFHVSRCGSTLVSQMLARPASNIVLSEAAPIDTILRAHHVQPDVTDDQRIHWLRLVIGALAEARRGDERHLFIKFDCWHTLELPLINRAFPDVPWIFLYRDPAEVLVSQLRQRGSFTIPGPTGNTVFGIPLDAALAMPPEEYLARILAKICDAAARYRSIGRGLMLNYRQLPDALFASICPHFGVEFSDADRVAMNGTTHNDAKSPRLPFAQDSAAKQNAATASVRAAAETWLGDVYRGLEAAGVGASGAAPVGH